MDDWKEIRRQTEQRRIARQIKAGRRVKSPSGRRSGKVPARAGLSKR